MFIARLHTSKIGTSSVFGKHDRAIFRWEFIARNVLVLTPKSVATRRHLARTSGVQSAQVGSGQYGGPSSQVERTAWDGAWSMKPETPRLTTGRQHHRSWLLYRLSNLTGSGKGMRPMRPPKMAAVSKIAPGLSLAASAELIFSLFLTVISDDCRARTRRHRRLDVGSGQHVVRPAVKGVGKRDDERKTEPVMGEALRFFVFLYPILGPEGGEKGGGERKRLVEKKKGIPKSGFGRTPSHPSHRIPFLAQPVCKNVRSALLYPREEIRDTRATPGILPRVFALLQKHFSRETNFRFRELIRARRVVASSKYSGVGDATVLQYIETGRQQTNHAPATNLPGSNSCRSAAYAKPPGLYSQSSGAWYAMMAVTPESRGLNSPSTEDQWGNFLHRGLKASEILHEEKTIVPASLRLLGITGYGRCIYGDFENVAYGELRDGRILRDARGAVYRITSVPRANSDRNFLDQLSIGLQLPIYSQSIIKAQWYMKTSLSSEGDKNLKDSEL
ncbi:hypothetical protein EAG_09110 [Camponotus floridanus]|uniref:Uncharacterized protein n=1 Tax=Camponotus floridanus TaxID=104421 RepID=E2AHB9_CAMFO|nr:hypothetical protein EAG_09110 [Camponotus floridanus]